MTGTGKFDRPGEAAWIVLEELGGARGADDDGFRGEAVVSLAYCGLEQLRRVGAEIARLERRICHRGARAAAFDHGKQQIRVRVALRGVQHVVQAPHRCRDPHRADVRRSFVCPKREVHRLDLQQVAANKRPREEFGEIARLLITLDRREDELDRPLGREALRLQRISKTKATNDEIGTRCATAIELPVDVLAFAQRRTFWEEFKFGRDKLTIDIGRADLDRIHRQFA